MTDGSRWLRRAAAGAAWVTAAFLAQPAFAARDLSAAEASADATRLVNWVRDSGDARGRPFAVVDKRAARLYVFDSRGHLAGETPAILGSTVGDFTVPGVGERTQNGTLRADERTTPAGRFEAEPGRNLKGEHVVWVDYDAAFAIHRVRPGAAYKTRMNSLAVDSPANKRLSWGCVVVPVAFYRQVVERVLGNTRSVVYVMPESRTLQSFMQVLDQRDGARHVRQEGARRTDVASSAAP